MWRGVWRRCARNKRTEATMDNCNLSKCPHVADLERELAELRADHAAQWGADRWSVTDDGALYQWREHRWRVWRKTDLNQAHAHWWNECAGGEYPPAIGERWIEPREAWRIISGQEAK